MKFRKYDAPRDVKQLEKKTNKGSDASKGDPREIVLMFARILGDTHVTILTETHDVTAV